MGLRVAVERALRGGVQVGEQHEHRTDIPVKSGQQVLGISEDYLMACVAPTEFRRCEWLTASGSIVAQLRLSPARFPVWHASGKIGKPRHN